MPILVEHPLVSAPNCQRADVFEFIYAIGAAQPGSIRKKTGAPWSKCAAARFAVEYQALCYLLTCHQRKAALRWRPYSSRRHAQAPGKGWRGMRALTSRRAAGPPLRAPGQQAACKFGVRIEQHTDKQRAISPLS